MKKYRCDSCGYTADESKFKEARDLSMRLDPGGTYTDLECPKADCGALAYPVKPKAPKGRRLTTYFHNVRIAITAPSSKAAYTKLCDALATIDSADWDTDTYTTDRHDEHRTTARLFPNFGKQKQEG